MYQGSGSKPEGSAYAGHKPASRGSWQDRSESRGPGGPRGYQGARTSKGPRGPRDSKGSFDRRGPQKFREDKPEKQRLSVWDAPTIEPGGAETHEATQPYVNDRAPRPTYGDRDAHSAREPRADRAAPYDSESFSRSKPSRDGEKSFGSGKPRREGERFAGPGKPRREWEPRGEKKFTRDTASARKERSANVEDEFASPSGDATPIPPLTPPGAMPKSAMPHEFIVEGRRAVASALESPLKVRALIILREEGETASKFGDLEDLALRRAIEVRHIEARNARRYLSTQHPQGVAALVERPALLPLEEFFGNARRILILDCLGDPGNAGTLVRTAFLLGWDGVAVTPGTVDLFGEKASRASAGAIAFIPVVKAPAAELARAASAAGYKLVVTALDGELVAAPSEEKICVILGNEAHGVMNAWPAASRVRLATRPGPIDSLGVVASGAILLEQLK